MTTNNRTSTYTQVSTSSDPERPKSSDTKKDLWSSLLDSVASGKQLPEKNVLVLGGSSDSQREFLETLSADDAKKSQGRHGSKQPPVANSFALGYTYHDVLDADQEDTLARLSLYLLADPSPAFTSLLQPLLTPQTIPNTLIVILLDWSQPWFWLRQLRGWIRLLRALLVSLDSESKEKMEEVMIGWRDRGRGGNNLDGSGSNPNAEGDVSLPLGPGEWEEALGLPLCVSDQIDVLEKERSWKEEEFDFVLQFLRTILLKRIHSLLKRRPLKHNVIDRDKVVVPPNWDSWGKIRVLREGFDVEAVNRGWSLDIEESLETITTNGTNDDEGGEPRVAGGAIGVYEETIRDPSLDALQATASETSGFKLEVSSLETQTFLAKQHEVLEKAKVADQKDEDGNNRLKNGRQVSQPAVESIEDGHADEGRVNEHIGPVQFNMGGIQVDADDMLQRLKDRQAHQQTPEPTSPGLTNEAIASFFAGLMKRGGGSTTSSPKPAP
ncbi:hypothetical protein B7494_g7122 [Chlorociboria aeruginascens]|nr:hypothetical protein B7494_g7122 [Chlorociboria aeruginascens]